MVRNVLTFATIFAVALPVAAEAQKIRSECVKMRDQLACTCALNNRGCISADGKNWYSVCGHSTNNNAMPNQAFTDCIRRARGG
jgi:hypothetical protein